MVGYPGNTSILPHNAKGALGSYQYIGTTNLTKAPIYMLMKDNAFQLVFIFKDKDQWKGTVTINVIIE